MAMYSGSLSAVRDTQNTIQKAIKEETRDDVKDVLSGLLYQLEDIQAQIEYLMLPAREGELSHNLRGRYYIRFEDGEMSNDLTSGHPVEVFLDGEWNVGRVEHRDGSYYFYGGDRPFLADGMRARIRIKD